MDTQSVTGIVEWIRSLSLEQWSGYAVCHWSSGVDTQSVTGVVEWIRSLSLE